MRPGGEWSYINHAADREPVTFYGEYLEIEAPSRFRVDVLFDVPGVGPQGGPETHTFEDLGGRVRSVGEMGSVSEIEAAVAIGMIEGGLQLWDRLAASSPKADRLAQQVAPAERDLVHRRHRQPRPAEGHRAGPDVDVDRRDRAFATSEPRVIPRTPPTAERPAGSQPGAQRLDLRRP